MSQPHSELVKAGARLYTSESRRGAGCCVHRPAHAPPPGLGRRARPSLSGAKSLCRSSTKAPFHQHAARPARRFPVPPRGSLRSSARCCSRPRVGGREAALPERSAARPQRAQSSREAGQASRPRGSGCSARHGGRGVAATAAGRGLLRGAERVRAGHAWRTRSRFEKTVF